MSVAEVSGLGAPERFLLWVFRRFPPREQDVIFKQPAGRADTEYEDEGRLPFYWNFGLGSELFRDKDVLDLGSGFGGRPVRFLEHGAATVVGLEISEEHVLHGARFADARGVGDRVSFVCGTGENIPCEDERFDLVTMYDVMEHVVSPRLVMRESWRVLRPGGALATVFPPFYDVLSGSHLHGYATRAPGLNVLFPAPTLKRAATALLKEQGVDYEPYFRECPSDKLWNMNGLTVRGFKRLIRETEFEAELLKYAGHLQERRHFDGSDSPPTRQAVYKAAQSAAQVPWLQELCCSRICAVLRKPALASD